MRWVAGVVASVFLAATACSSFTPSTATVSPHAASTHAAGTAACPQGKTARAGLENFGAYIGTWQAGHLQNPQAPSEYAMVQAPGRVIPRCSNDDLVVVEQMYFLFYVPSGLALRVALTDIPSDSTKLYDHVHAGCRTLQYQSAKLAHQLGPDDKDGRLNITLVSAADVYDGAAVAGALIDVAVPLGQDTRPC